MGILSEDALSLFVFLGKKRRSKTVCRVWCSKINFFLDSSGLNHYVEFSSRSNCNLLNELHVNFNHQKLLKTFNNKETLNFWSNQMFIFLASKAMYYVVPIQRKMCQKYESLYICCYVRIVSCQRPCILHAACKLILFNFILLSMLPLSFPFSLASGPDALAPDTRLVWTASNCWFASCIWHNESVLCYVSNRLLDNFESLWAYIVHGLICLDFCV
jgi:hypothetical protein